MKFYRAWEQFWFDSNRDDTLLALSLFRILFYSVMLFFYISRAGDISILYGDAGLFPAEFARSLPQMKYHYSFLYGVHNLFYLHALHTIFLLLLLACVLGLFTRVTTILAFVMHLMFIGRNMSAIFGVDMIGTYFLLYCCFANMNAYWSLDRCIFRKSPKPKSTLISFIAFRLMQLQLCVVYAYSGLEKLKGTRWWDGSALWDVLCIGNMQRWDMSFVSHMPLLLSLGGYIVLFWEIYFCVLVWNQKWKNTILIIGVLLHLGIAIFMNLPSFGAMMISFYVLFLSSEEIYRILRFIPSRN